MRTKNSVILAVFLCTVLGISLIPGTTYGAEPSVGAVNNWFSLSGGSYVSVDMKPLAGGNGYHYYSLSPFFQGQNFGLYSGIQTNGNLGNGVDVGNLFIFSVWNARVAFPENGATATPFDGEGVGYSLRKTYDWEVGQTYTITIRRGGYDAPNNGWRWAATITHKETATSLKLGEITAPAGADFVSTGSAFHERYAGFAPVCSATGTNLEQAGVTFSGLASDKPISFSGKPEPNNIFASTICAPYLHMTSNATSASTGIGMVASEFSTLLTAGPQTPKNPAPPPTPRTNNPLPPFPVPETALTQAQRTNPISPTLLPQATKAKPRTNIFAWLGIALVCAALGAVLIIRKRRVLRSASPATGPQESQAPATVAIHGLARQLRTWQQKISTPRKDR